MKTGTLLVVGIALIAVAFVVSLFLLKLGWGWVIPDIFPGAVETGLIVGSLTWNQAIKLAILLTIVAAFGFRGSSSNK